MKIKISKSKLEGKVNIPPSKSLTHRALIAASLAQGRSIISNVAYSKDILATIEACKAIGAKIEKHDDYLIIDGTTPKRCLDVIDCFESGSTLRFMIPIALLADEKITFVGRNRLNQRPLDLYLDIFDKCGIRYEKGSDSLPLTIYDKLKPGDFYLKGDVSSQFISGLLFSLPLLNGDSKIIITTKLESKGYIDLTIDILKKYGIEIIQKDNSYIVKGNQEYKPRDYKVEGDYSQAAFFLVGNMLGGNIKLEGLEKDSLQGDKKIIDFLNQIGGNIYFEGKDLVCQKNNLHSAIIDLGQTPDLGPILSVLLAQIEGESKLINAQRLRIKECDRITCVKEELIKCNALVSETKDEMHFKGRKLEAPSVDLLSHNDHRLVMAFAIMASFLDGDTYIDGVEAINKSYPNFFDDFKSLGGKIEIYE